MRTLNVGDYFLVSRNSISEMLGEDRVDEENVKATIKYFEEHGVEYFKGVVNLINGNMAFEQYFLDENKEKVDIKAAFGSSFLLHLDSICKKEESYYSGEISSIDDKFNVNGKDFYDGDLYTIPLSAMVEYDKKPFSDQFNESIERALSVGLKNIVLSVNFKDGERKSAGDDLTDYFSDKNTERFDYSQFSLSKSPAIRLFITNNLGENHFSLGDLDSKEDYESLISDNTEIVSRKFFSEKVCQKHNSNVLNFISTLKENTLSLLLDIKEVMKNIDFIGNFRSEKYNFIGAYDMRNHFKEYKLNKMINLNDVKAIFIKKEDLPEEEKQRIGENSTHIVVLSLPNQLDHRYLNLFKVEAVFSNGVYNYSKDKESISAFQFNKLIEESKDINVVKNNGEKQPEVEFEYNQYRQMIKEKSEVFNGIEKGYAYIVNLSDIKNIIKSKSALQTIEKVENLGANAFILNVSSPHYFLMSDSPFENNEKIYIDRTRFVEMKLYPVSGANHRALNLDLISLMDKEELTKENIERMQEIALKKGSINDVYVGDFKPMDCINLETFDALNVISKVKDKMLLIEDRKNPYFNMTTSLDDSILKMFSRIMSKKMSEEKEVKKTPTIKL